MGETMAPSKHSGGGTAGLGRASKKRCRDCTQEKPYHDFPTNYSKKCNQCAEKKASESMKCKRCGQTKSRSDFCHDPNKCLALDHCAACKDLVECKVCRRFKQPTE